MPNYLYNLTILFFSFQIIITIILINSNIPSFLPILYLSFVFNKSQTHIFNFPPIGYISDLVKLIYIPKLSMTVLININLMTLIFFRFPSFQATLMILSPPPPNFPAEIAWKADDDDDGDEWSLLAGEWSCDRGVGGGRFNDNGKGSMRFVGEAFSFKFKLAIFEDGGTGKIGVGLIGLARPIGNPAPGKPP